MPVGERPLAGTGTGPNIQLECAQATRAGKAGGANQDSLMADAGLGLFAIADGTSGSANGALAGRLALDAFCRGVRARLASVVGPAAGCSVAEALSAAIQEANSALRSASLTAGTLCTTLTAALIRDGELFLAHCGDSRAYLVGPASVPVGTRVELLTQDHTIVGDMCRAGTISEGEARRHPRRNILSSCLGMFDRFRMQAACRKLARGETLLLCTDGLWSFVDSAGIAACAEGPVAAAAERLSAAALAGGSSDDITVIVVRVA